MNLKLYYGIENTQIITYHNKICTNKITQTLKPAHALKKYYVIIYKWDTLKIGLFA
jgi:hypothetical protein